MSGIVSRAAVPNSVFDKCHFPSARRFCPASAELMLDSTLHADHDPLSSRIVDRQTSEVCRKRHHGDVDYERSVDSLREHDSGALRFAISNNWRLPRAMSNPLR